MFSVELFRKNIYTYYYNHIKCPLCQISNNNKNKYDGVEDNVTNVSIIFHKDNYAMLRHFYYCLFCETLFSISHPFEINNYSTYHINNFWHVYIISEFKYENEVIIGTPHFESIFSLCKDIKENKLNNITFTCTCDDNPTSSNALLPEMQYPKYYNKCCKSVKLNKITEVNIGNRNLLLFPNNTKRAIK